MKSLSETQKVKRNLKMIFLLAFLIAVLASVSGGYVLIAGYGHPDVAFTMPAWEYGQFIMLFGLVNLFIYLCICFQVRKLFRGDGDVKNDS